MKNPKTQEKHKLKPAQRVALLNEGLDPSKWIKIHETMSDFAVIRKGTKGKRPGDRRELRW